MTGDRFSDGDAVLFMKIGTHADEDLANIIARKRREIEEAGFSMWGYGGNTCHPRTIVQPFARSRGAAGHPTVLCMHPMTSRHFADPIRAEEFSVDGSNWKPIPDRINVLGSRYAVCIKALQEVDDALLLADTRVGIGNSKGRPGNEYIRGHVDKACLDVVAHAGDDSPPVPIQFVAEIVEPYAVLLRN